MIARSDAGINAPGYPVVNGLSRRVIALLQILRVQVEAGVMLCRSMQESE